MVDTTHSEKNRKLHSKMLLAKSALSILQKEYEASRRSLLLQDPEMMNTFYELAPEELQPWLRHVNVFGELMEHGTFYLEYVKIAAAPESEQLRRLFAELERNGRGLIEIRYHVPDNLRTGNANLFLMFAPPKEVPL